MHTIVGKLNRPANTFKAGESTGFGIKLGQKYKDRKTGEDEWTNYSAVIFAKSPAQIAFYEKILVYGAVVEVSGDGIRVDQYTTQDGSTGVNLELLNARLGFVSGSAENAPQGERSASNGVPRVDDDLPF